jgi:hypothetical protein
MPIRLLAHHPWKSPGETVWTLWGRDEALIRERLDALADHKTLHYGNPEIAALVLRRDDRLGTIEGGWTREAVPVLIASLPEQLADLRAELADLFAPSDRSDRRAAGA